jgi:hypothetical protein
VPTVENGTPPVGAVGNDVPFDRGYGADVATGNPELGDPLEIAPLADRTLPVGVTALVLELVRLNG